MKRSIITTVIVLLCTSVQCVAQGNIRMISGTVTDGKEPLAGANVFIYGTINGCTTDSLGRFRFETDAKGEAELCATYIGQAREMIEKARQAIAAIEKMPAADVSDLCMLRGFLYTTIIVQDPMKNGPQYYRDVIENFEKALKVNPDNKLARELYERFKEGMRGAR